MCSPTHPVRVPPRGRGISEPVRAADPPLLPAGRDTPGIAGGRRSGRERVWIFWVPESEGVSREELLAILAAKDARIDALLVQVGELTAQLQTLVLRLGKDSSAGRVLT